MRKGTNKRAKSQIYLRISERKYLGHNVRDAKKVLNTLYESLNNITFVSTL